MTRRPEAWALPSWLIQWPSDFTRVPQRVFSTSLLDPLPHIGLDNKLKSPHSIRKSAAVPSITFRLGNLQKRLWTLEEKLILRIPPEDAHHLSLTELHHPNVSKPHVRGK